MEQIILAIAMLCANHTSEETTKKQCAVQMLSCYSDYHQRPKQYGDDHYKAVARCLARIK